VVRVSELMNRLKRILAESIEEGLLSRDTVKSLNLFEDAVRF